MLSHLLLVQASHPHDNERIPVEVTYHAKGNMLTVNANSFLLIVVFYIPVPMLLISCSYHPMSS